MASLRLVFACGLLGILTITALPQSPDPAVYTPQWIRDGFATGGTTHEPWLFLLRTNKRAEWQKEEYDYRLSEEYIRSLAQAGVTVYHIFFYKGFGFAAEEAHMKEAARAAAIAHRHGLKVDTYIQWNSLFYETFFKEVPAAKRDRWYQVDESGKPILLTYGHQQSFRYRPCFNHQAYMDYFKEKILRFAVEQADTDFVHFDNFDLNPPGESCHNPATISAFRRYLTEKYPPPVRRERFGFEDVSEVLPPVWNQSNPPETMLVIQDPLLQEWAEFRAWTMISRLAECARFVRGLKKEVVIEINPHGILGNNRVWERGIDHPGLMKYTNVIWTEDDNNPRWEDGVAIGKFRHFKLGRTTGNFILTYNRTPQDFAENLALNRTPAWLGQGIPDGQGKIHLDFWHRHQDLFTHCQGAEKVAVLRSHPSVAYNNLTVHNSVNMAEQALQQRQIPFDIIFDQQLGFLSRYSVLVLANQESLADETVEKINRFVRDGGGLVVTEDTGLYDHWRRQRQSKAFSEMFGWQGESADRPSNTSVTLGRGKAVYLPDLGLPDGRPLDPRVWKIPLRADQLKSAVLDVSEPPLPLIVEGPEWLGVSHDHQSGRDIVHLFSYRHDRPAFEARLRFRGPVSRAWAVSPHRSGKQELQVAVSGAEAIVTVPELSCYEVVVLESGSNPSDKDSLAVYSSGDERAAAESMVHGFIDREIEARRQKRLDELALLRAPQDWRARQDRTRARLSEFFGDFPPRTPLNSRTVGKLERERYTIEKVVFESRPHYYVTANLYLPRNAAAPRPAVFIPCGHSDPGKAYIHYHSAALGFVLKGYVVLVMDPMGQGERSEYFDPVTLKPLVGMSVSQHHYVGRPAFLVDWSLSGLRLWDCIRAVDYLVSRPEVDQERLAAAGNSGGGQMALLITAVDERIKACAAGHPGGSMENTYLKGQDPIDREILSLIPPRPCRIIVGDQSGEEARHRTKLDDMLLFYRGLGAGTDKADLVLVDGVHDLKQPKREAAYEWLNQWVGDVAAGSHEDALQLEDPEALWCTKKGVTLAELGGESGQSLNALRLRQAYHPADDLQELRDRIARRIQLSQTPSGVPPSRIHGSLEFDGVRVTKFSYASEPGIRIPGLLLEPGKSGQRGPVVIHVSDQGKPQGTGDSLCVLLAGEGLSVVSLDLRGIGETSPSTVSKFDRYTGYTPEAWRQDTAAIKALSIDRTMLGMRVYDLLAGLNWVDSQPGLQDRPVFLLGEGLGGVWVLMASTFDKRPEGVITVGTLVSYKRLIENRYYALRGYFWVPGALKDFDIPDLSRAALAPVKLWLNPADQMGATLPVEEAQADLTTAGVSVQLATSGYEIAKSVRNFIGSPAKK